MLRFLSCPMSCVLSCLLALAFASPVLADTSVVVLGLRSIEGDDDVAHDVTQALRRSAEGIVGWSVSTTAVSMAQMSLAHGCDDVDAACLADMARGLSADRIVYGTLRRNSAREDYNYALSLNLYDAQAASIARSIDDTILRTETDPSSLAAHATRLIHRLAGVSQGGAIIVQANLSDAEVHINGQVVGQLIGGSARYDGMQAGAYRVEVHAQGYAPHVSTVNVVDGQDAIVSAELQTAALSAEGYDTVSNDREPPRMGHGLSWLGWTLVGVSAVTMAGAIFSWVRISDIDSDPLLVDYRHVVALSNQAAKNSGDTEIGDVCKAAELGLTYEPQGFDPADVPAVQDLCSSGDTFEVLQYVFLGTAIVSGGIGTYLLLTAGDGGSERADRSKPTWSLSPQVGRHHGALSATLRF